MVAQMPPQMQGPPMGGAMPMPAPQPAAPSSSMGIDLARLRERWHGKLLVKGVARADDAKRRADREARREEIAPRARREEIGETSGPVHRELGEPLHDRSDDDHERTASDEEHDPSTFTSRWVGSQRWVVALARPG